VVSKAVALWQKVNHPIPDSQKRSLCSIPCLVFCVWPRAVHRPGAYLQRLRVRGKTEALIWFSCSFCIPLCAQDGPWRSVRGSSCEFAEEAAPQGFAACGKLFMQGMWLATLASWQHACPVKPDDATGFDVFSRNRTARPSSRTLKVTWLRLLQPRRGTKRVPPIAHLGP
jgi:hypothetical protein